MHDCSNCSGCSGNGCGGELTLTEPELEFLHKLGECAFLPVARRMGDLTPVYLEDGEEKAETIAHILQCLEKKNLISLDYDAPLHGSELAAYAMYPLCGSMALTERGQRVLELVEYLGVSEEG